MGGSESVKEGREGKKENGGGEEAVISSECSEMKPLKKGEDNIFFLASLLYSY